MRFKSILVVCIGNICRSPLGERILAQALPDTTISSAGLGAVVGAGADPEAAKAAAELGIDLSGHVARQLTSEIGQQSDLILVMEPAHRTEVIRRFPQLAGRVMLFSQWTGSQPIPDPYKRGTAAHILARDLIVSGGEAWIKRLAPK